LAPMATSEKQNDIITGSTLLMIRVACSLAQALKSNKTLY
jgi:hypothetical protein